MRIRVLGAAGVLLLTPAVVVAGTDVPGSNVPAQMIQAPTEVTPSSSAEAAVLGRLHADNQAEIAHGQLAIEKGKDAAVKAYGRQLVADHTAADQKVVALAKKTKVSPTAMASEATIEAEKGRSDPKMSALHNLSGDEFDKQFVSMMAEEHDRTIDFVNGACEATTNPELKALLTKLLPTLEKHASEARKLAGTLGKPSS